MGKIKAVWLFTNRNALIFDEKGEQIPEAQGAIDCYSIDPAVARQVCNEAREFHIAKWGGWSHEITRKEMLYLLGLVTKEEDLMQTAT